MLSIFLFSFFYFYHIFLLFPRTIISLMGDIVVINFVPFQLKLLIYFVLVVRSKWNDTKKKFILNISQSQPFRLKWFLRILKRKEKKNESGVMKKKYTYVVDFDFFPIFVKQNPTLPSSSLISPLGLPPSLSIASPAKPIASAGAITKPSQSPDTLSPVTGTHYTVSSSSFSIVFSSPFI